MILDCLHCKIQTVPTVPTTDGENEEEPNPAPEAGTTGDELLQKVIYYKKGYLAMFRDVFEVESTYFANYENNEQRQAALDKLATSIGKERFDNAWTMVVLNYQQVGQEEALLRKYSLNVLLAAQGQELTPETFKANLESGLFTLPSATEDYPISLFR